MSFLKPLPLQYRLSARVTSCCHRQGRACSRMRIVGLKSAREIRLLSWRRFLTSSASPFLLACLTLAFKSLLQICHESIVTITPIIKLQCCCLLRGIPVFDLLPVVILAVDHICFHQPFVLLTLSPMAIILFRCGLVDSSLLLLSSFLLS